MKPEDFHKSLDKQQADEQKQQDKQAEIGAINKAGIKNVQATNAAADKITAGTQSIKGTVEVTNPDLAKSGDIASTIDAIHKLNLTTFNSNQGLPQLADNLVKLSDGVQQLQKDYESKGLSALSKQLSAVVKQLQDVSKTLGNTKISVDSKLQATIDSLQKSITGIDFNPTVNVKAPTPKVVQTPVNLQPIVEGLASVEKAINDSEQPEPDLTPVTQGLNEVRDTIANLSFPVPNYVLPFQDSNGKATQVKLDTSGNVPISGNITATIDESTLATSANQINGTQQTQSFGVDSAATQHQILTDSAGRTKISHGQPDPVTGTIDAVNDQVAVPSDGFSDVIFYFTPLGSHIITFEQSPDSTTGSDGTWFSVLAASQGTIVAAAVTATMTTTKVVYRVSSPAGSWIRARVSTQTTPGSCAVQAVTTSAMAQPQITLPTTTVTATPATPTSHVLHAAGTTNATSVKSSSARLYNLELTNYAAYDVFYKIYNKASAPTVGTDIPVVVLRVPAGGNVTRQYVVGMLLGTGYAFAMTKLQADSDTTALVAGDLAVKGDYI